MTDRELMQEAWEALNLVLAPFPVDDIRCMRVAKKLQERLAQPEQEPVAWRWKERINSDFDSWVISASEPPPYAIEQQPLYANTGDKP